ncbi:MAG TPA: fumarylacetoacetate hydrolase family protein [Burkholderiales bacterium]|nr:fumarylacetoacetate hydrolase family protein [Burkholderiales bacterium]
MQWLRFSRQGKSAFGFMEAGSVRACRGDMFSAWERTDELIALDEIRWETPCTPTKMIALWNNFHQAAAKFALAIPEEPLFFVKSANSFCPHKATIRAPKSYSGKVLYEGELGIVIGKPGKDIAPDQAASHIFGYTCVNDMTALELLKSDPSFAQWTRAKSFDGFGPFGPVIATGVDPAGLAVRTLVNGKERQNYPVRDMIFPPETLVSLISRDLTLFSGDIISCGTSVGAGSLSYGATVEVVIDGVGTLSNQYA